MPDDFTQAVTIGGEIDADPHNDAWDNLEDFLNGTGVHVYQDGTIGPDALTSALAELLGLTMGADVRRGYAAVATEQSGPGPLWTNLATTGPSVTLDVAANGFALIGVSAEIKSQIPPNRVVVGVHEATDWSINGETISEETVILNSTSGSYPTKPLTALKLIPVTAGERTFTLKYAAANGGSFKNRKLWAIAMSF